MCSLPQHIRSISTITTIVYCTLATTILIKQKQSRGLYTWFTLFRSGAYKSPRTAVKSTPLSIMSCGGGEGELCLLYLFVLVILVFFLSRLESLCFLAFFLSSFLFFLRVCCLSSLSFCFLLFCGVMVFLA